MNNMKKLMTILPLAGILLLAGCFIVAVTVVIDYNISSTDLFQETDFEYFNVDLTDNDTWNDHKDDIQYIDNVGFVMWVENNGATDATGELYIARTHSTSIASAQDVKDNTTRILSGLVLPPGESYIDWPTSLGYVEHVDSLRAIVETGTFVIYATTESLPFDIQIDSAIVIVTGTASQ
jgi:hypothetical protein